MRWIIRLDGSFLQRLTAALIIGVGGSLVSVAEAQTVPVRARSGTSGQTPGQGIDVPCATASLSRTDGVALSGTGRALYGLLATACMESSVILTRASEGNDVGRLHEALAWIQRIALRRHHALAVLAVALLFVPLAQAVVSLREPDCGVWLKTRSPDVKDWVLGYLSGMNLVWNAEHKTPAEPLTALASLDEVFSWMDAYCHANPQQYLGRGAIVLFFELVKRKEGR